MQRTGISAIFAVVVVLAVVSTGCSSPGAYDPKVRREQLLAIYPPGSTTREDVKKKWSPVMPEFTTARPAQGWAALEYPSVRERVASSERRTGKSVQLVDCYVSPDSRSSFDLWGLCYCWFYYDAADKVVDVEWQYHTD